jgi:hypothetical protein
LFFVFVGILRSTLSYITKITILNVKTKEIIYLNSYVSIIIIIIFLSMVIISHQEVNNSVLFKRNLLRMDISITSLLTKFKLKPVNFHDQEISENG